MTVRRFGRLMAVALAAATVAPAMAVVVPNDRASTAGTGTFLGVLTNSARRYQLLIDSSQLTGLVGQQISGLQSRLLASATTSFPVNTTTYADYEIYLSASVDPSARSLTFADNIAGPQTQVRDGALVIPAGSYPVGGSPNAFGPSIGFNTPYTYSGGDLLVEIRHSASDGASVSNDAMLASGGAAQGYGTLFSAAWQSSVDATTGLQGNFTVVNLVTAVPEPTSLGLLALGGLAVLRRRR